MNKLYLLLCLFCLPLAVSAQTSFTIVENGVEQTVAGELKSADGIEYISTSTKHYQVTNTNTALLGDVNEDGKIDVFDVTLIIDMALSGSYSILADVDKDGSNVNVFDVTTTIDIALKLRTPETIVVSYNVTDVTNIWIKGGQDDGPVDQN
ncbi:MAG: hypothetical protein J5637_02680 [Prevotella sp.]|nr:hypothetical protein [Prevotella sp.]